MIEEGNVNHNMMYTCLTVVWIIWLRCLNKKKSRFLCEYSAPYLPIVVHEAAIDGLKVEILCHAGADQNTDQRTVGHHELQTHKLQCDLHIIPEEEREIFSGANRPWAPYRHCTPCWHPDGQGWFRCLWISSRSMKRTGWNVRHNFQIQENLDLFIYFGKHYDGWFSMFSRW